MTASVRLTPRRWLGSWLLAILPAFAAAQSSAPPAPASPPLAAQARPGIIVFGGTRATGLEIVRLLRARGDAVTVVVRPTSDTTAVKALGATTLIADAMDPAAMQTVLQGQQFRAAISTLGTTRGEKDRRPDFLGNKHAIDAVKAAGIPRFVMITVIGAGNSEKAAPWLARQFLKDVIALKTQAEDYLKASGLQWTIVRPGGLLDKPASGKAVLKTDPETFSWISRLDLAKVTVDILDSPAAAGQVYAAYDPTRENFWSMWAD
jgi:uncharacterized protein YbjT (DUF2867 family)